MMQVNTGLFIIVGIIFVVAGFLIYYYRDYLPIGPSKKRKKSNTDAIIEERLDRIRQLARQHDYNNASILVWQTFNDAAEGFLSMTREPNQTARQYGLSLMAFEGITPETVEPLYALFETARYSRDPVSLQEFNAGLTGLHRFLQLAKQISASMQSGKGRSTQAEEETPKAAS